MIENQKLDDRDCCQSFADSYEVSNLPAMRAIERAVLGCDYGGTSWTTCVQAEQLIGALELRPGRHLLEIGAGSGWPGVYLAKASGCDVTLVDLPLNALAKAVSRANDDGLAEQVSAVAGSGCALPFEDGVFEAISHSDVLCCLPEKLGMLAECRRVARDGAQMVFSIIAIVDGLQGDTYRRAVEAGPPFVESPASYSEMLAQTGWHVVDRIDVTDTHRESLCALVNGLNGSKDLLRELGVDVVRDTRERRQEQIDAIDASLMVREIYDVVAAAI